MMKKYGMGAAEARGMLDDQNHVCAICEDPITLMTCHVDHHHESGTVRSLLCLRCNVMLGYARESARILWRAAIYLDGDDPAASKRRPKGHIEQVDGRLRLVVEVPRDKSGCRKRRVRTIDPVPRREAEAQLEHMIDEVCALAVAKGAAGK